MITNLNLSKIYGRQRDWKKVTSRFCKDTNSCEPTWFEQVVNQNDQVERVNNLSILQGGTYRKQVGHSIELNKKHLHAKDALYQV